MITLANLSPLAILGAVSLFLGACSPQMPVQSFQPQTLAAIAGTPPDPIIAAAGDIACSAAEANRTSSPDRCQMQATAALLGSQNFAAILPLGDLQYPNGDESDFKAAYALSWGRFKEKSRPVVGNHEYGTRGASGYFRYFGTLAGNPNQGYYSYDVGRWHVIALNSNCLEVGGCHAGSPQEKWLKADLVAHPARCTLAYWHHPRFSSASHGNNREIDAFWQALYAAGADLILNGHDHSYERFAPQTPNGIADPKRGLRAFVVGTGGKSLYPIRTIQPNSEVRNNETYGVLKLTLQPDRYQWQFLPIKGQTFTDSGSSLCH